MTREFTLTQLRTMVEQRGDWENDTHLATDEKNQAIQTAAAETWDLLIAAGLNEKFLKSSTFNTISGTQEYDLTSATQVADTDFYKLSNVYVNEGNGQFRPIQRIHSAEVMQFRAPTSVVPMKIFYYPHSPTFKTAGSFDNNLTWNAENGSEEHIVLGAVAALKRKKDEDYRPFEQKREAVAQRLMRMGKVTWDGPMRVIRRRQRSNDPFMLYRGNVNAYLVRGTKLELLYHWGYTP